MTSAFRLAVTRAILMFHNCEGQTVTDHNLSEEKGEPKRIWTEVTLLQYQPNALPLGQPPHGDLPQIQYSLLSHLLGSRLVGPRFGGNSTLNVFNQPNFTLNAAPNFSPSSLSAAKKLASAATTSRHWFFFKLKLFCEGCPHTNRFP